jgi:small conductance mechanosensitive channel
MANLTTVQQLVDWKHWLNKGIVVGEHLLGAILIFFIGMFVARKVSNLILKLMIKRKVETTIAQFGSRLLYYLMVILVMMAVLNQLWVPTSSLLAVLGGMSLAIGLSMRSSLSNLASGLLLVLFRPFKVGDSIKISSYTGTVIDIQILYTQIKTSQQQTVTMPNDQFMKNAVLNYSVNNNRRADIVIGISYDDDITAAKKIVSTVLLSDQRVLSDPAPMVVVKELADSSVNLLARFFTDRLDYWSTVYAFNEQVKLQLDEAGISMPYPQQDVHLHSVPETK